MPVPHCVFAAHRNVVESGSQESLTCREKCWPSVLSLAVSFLLIFSFSFDRICIRLLRPSPGSCLNHWKKLKLRSVYLQSSVKLSPSRTFRKAGLCSTCDPVQESEEVFMHKELFLVPLGCFIFLRIKPRLSLGSL